ncbi:MAG TPA: STAS domain-containing protein [Bryobacteraceae bacterium]|nr:STAS domain-containing protein [Bryobacteraceae bacterium]HOQ47295.1 STAS domain-containing protein [Bryobacteraceae bacterium]HPQ16600.1 STAS domain-containing protein [Bryobacteraceae bacterium]HPU73755.1 STAS domain-containing protein [Bryobacteraceae bacterium]
MEITRADVDGCPELRVSGRLDSYWSRHLGEAIDELLREGIHRARLNLADTSYISSAGIRVLLQAYKQFVAVGGALVVVEPSARVREVLDLAGLGTLLGTAAVAPAKEAARGDAVVWRLEEDGCAFEAYDCERGARLAWRVEGSPELLPAAAFEERHAATFKLSRDVMALGIGAFGDSWAACRERFGEFLAVGGCAACQPTDETGCADDMVSTGTFTPSLMTLHSLSCQGKFARLVRFESAGGGGPVGLTTIVRGCLAAAGPAGEAAPAAGVVLVAESAGLLGAALKRPPVGNGNAALFRHPEVRQWLSFSPVRSHTRAVAVVVGVAARAPVPEPPAKLLRPLDADGKLVGHFHAAAFGYRPLRKGYIEMEATVRRLFEGGGLQGVLHLLADHRPGCGAGESEFTRGACWVGPLESISSPEQTS